MNALKKTGIALLALIFVAVIALLVFIIYKLGLFTNKQGSVATGQQQTQNVVKSSAKEYTVNLGDFTVNLQDPDYKRYMKVSVYAGYTTKGLETELSEKNPAIKDIINDVLRSKKLDDVNSPDKTKAIKKELKDKLNPLLSTGQLTNIYFNEIIVQ